MVIKAYLLGHTSLYPQKVTLPSSDSDDGVIVRLLSGPRMREDY